MIARLFTFRGAVFLFGVIVLGVIIFSAMLPKIQPESAMPDDSTIAYITAELDRKSAGNCVLESIEGGWKCTTHGGKVYKVKAK